MLCAVVQPCTMPHQSRFKRYAKGTQKRSKWRSIERTIQDAVVTLQVHRKVGSGLHIRRGGSEAGVEMENASSEC